MIEQGLQVLGLALVTLPHGLTGHLVGLGMAAFLEIVDRQNAAVVAPVDVAAGTVVAVVVRQSLDCYRYTRRPVF
jgi:hypothetical protein